jgi:hypothetical protein
MLLLVIYKVGFCTDAHISSKSITCTTLYSSHPLQVPWLDLGLHGITNMSDFSRHIIQSKKLTKVRRNGRLKKKFFNNIIHWTALEEFFPIVLF